MSQSLCSTFAAMTRTILERFLSNSTGMMLSGKGTSSRDKKSNKQSISRERPMQVLVNNGLQIGKPERSPRMTVHNIYKVPANVLARSPSKMNAQFKSMTLNSSSKGIPVRNWVVMYYSVSTNPHAAFVLCLSTGIYHKGNPMV